MEPSPAAAECAVRNIRAGRVEAEELLEDDLELVFSEGRLHILMLSMWGSRGTWSKKDGVGQLVIFFDGFGMLHAGGVSRH